MKKTTFFLVLAGLILGGTYSIADSPVIMSKPYPLQIKQEVTNQIGDDIIPDNIYAEDIVSISHPKSTFPLSKNFLTDTIGLTDVQVPEGYEIEDTLFVDDFVLTPGELITQSLMELNDDFFLNPQITFGDLSSSQLDFEALEGRGVYIADVRMPHAEEVPLLPPIVFMGAKLTPYAVPFAMDPLPAPAYSLTKFRGSQDIALVSYGNVDLQTVDGSTVTIKSPVTYLKMTEEGLYRVAGVLSNKDYPNEEAIDIEAVNINGDLVEDFAVINRKIISGKSYVRFFLGTANIWEVLVNNATFEVVEQNQPAGLEPFDSAVMSSKNFTAGVWEDALMIPSFYPNDDGDYEIYKYDKSNYASVNAKVISIGGKPQFLSSGVYGNPICEAGDGCGPVRIECTRDFETDDQYPIFDLNNDGCGDCVVTWGKIVESESNIYFDLFSGFTLLLSGKDGDVCADNFGKVDHVVVDKPVPLISFFAPDPNEIAPHAQAFAIEIANVDPENNKCLDIWIGDQTVYKREEIDSLHDMWNTYVYLYKTHPDGLGFCEFKSQLDYVDVFKANYHIKLDKLNYSVTGGGGVKALAADRYGNLGVINGSPFIPAKDLCPLMPGIQSIDEHGPDGIGGPNGIGDACECGRDLDNDNWGDALPGEIVLNGETIIDPCIIQDYVQCDKCVTDLFTFDAPGCEISQLKDQKKCTADDSELCKNEQLPNGDWSEETPQGCKMSIVIPEGGFGIIIQDDEIEIPQYEVPDIVIPLCDKDFDGSKMCEYDNPDESKTYTSADLVAGNDINNNCEADCHMFKNGNIISGKTCNLVFDRKPTCCARGTFKCEISNYEYPNEQSFDGSTHYEDKDKDCVPDFIKVGNCWQLGCYLPCDAKLDCEDYFKADEDCEQYRKNDGSPDAQKYYDDDFSSNFLIRVIDKITSVISSEAFAEDVKESEATVLINIKEKKLVPPPDGPDPITPTPTPGVAVDQYRVDVDRGEVADTPIKPFIMRIQEYNNKFREIVGLPIDLFVPEIWGTYTASIPLSAAIGYADDAVSNFNVVPGAIPLYQSSGMLQQNYNRIRPNYNEKLVRPSKPLVLVPSAEVAGDISFSSSAALMPSGSVAQEGASSFSISGGIMNVKYDKEESSTSVLLNANMVATSPVVARVSGVGGYEACAWGIPPCHSPVPTRSVSPAKVLKIAAEKVAEYKEAGKTVDCRIVEEIVEESNYDPLGYLTQKFIFSTLTEEGLSIDSKAMSIKDIGQPLQGDLNKVMLNVAESEGKGFDCPLNLLVARGEGGAAGGGGCGKCSISEGKPNFAEYALYFLMFLPVIIFYFRQRFCKK